MRLVGSFVFVVCLGLTAPCYAQQSSAESDCMALPAAAQSGCLEKLANAADAKLNEVYRRAISGIEKSDVTNIAAWKAELKKAQQAWIVFRDMDCGALAAYALSRRRIPWKGPLLLIVLFLTGVPLAILIIPIFELFSDLGWLSILPCALFLAVTTLPFEIYLIKNFIDAVPQDLEEAARMERAGTMQILLKVIGPLAMPGIAAAAIFGFVTAWGSFLIPLVLITSPNQQPGSIAIFGFIGAAHVQYGNIAAFSLVYAVPIFLLYALSSRLFRGGFVLSGAVRG